MTNHHGSRDRQQTFRMLRQFVRVRLNRVQLNVDIRDNVIAAHYPGHEAKAILCWPFQLG